jgi:hypothetical protein
MVHVVKIINKLYFNYFYLNLADLITAKYEIDVLSSLVHLVGFDYNYSYL